MILRHNEPIVTIKFRESNILSDYSKTVSKSIFSISGNQLGVPTKPAIYQNSNRPSTWKSINL